MFMPVLVLIFSRVFADTPFVFNEAGLYHGLHADFYPYDRAILDHAKGWKIDDRPDPLRFHNTYDEEPQYVIHAGSLTSEQICQVKALVLWHLWSKNSPLCRCKEYPQSWKNPEPIVGRIGSSWVYKCERKNCDYEMACIFFGSADETPSRDDGGNKWRGCSSHFYYLGLQRTPQVRCGTGMKPYIKLRKYDQATDEFQVIHCIPFWQGKEHAVVVAEVVKSTDDEKTIGNGGRMSDDMRSPLLGHGRSDNVDNHQ